jgi:hypothetical protein
VILSRGWQPHGFIDPRPYHRVDSPVDAPRLMFQLRRNIAAVSPPSPLLSDTETNQAVGLAATPTARRR